MRWAAVTLLIVGVFALQTAPALAAPQDDRGFVGRVLDLTNAERQQAGLGPLAISTQLNDAAQGYSQVLASDVSPRFTEMGVGMVSGGKYGAYWTQEFGSRPVAPLQFAPLPQMDEEVVLEDSSG